MMIESDDALVMLLQPGIQRLKLHPGSGVGAVRVSILLTQVNPGLTKISFRSKPASAEQDATDVNELANHFGGGGHRHAAGARLDMNIDEAKAVILSVLE